MFCNNTFSIHLKIPKELPMKRHFTLFLVLFLTIKCFAQAPNKFSYQTVVRNSGGQLLANQQIAIKISILQGSETGIVVYAERHTPITNNNGLASIQIGGGSVLNGSMASINWAQGPYFISTETDPNGGSNYSIASTQQLLSVPFALYAETSINSESGPQGPQGPQGTQGSNGTTGNNGLSAYEIWLNNGNSGSENDFLNSLVGSTGSSSLDQQSVSFSVIGDTLFLTNGGFAIIPGIGNANSGNILDSISYHSCDAEYVHNFNVNYGSVTDQDGNICKTIILGGMEWMAENLNVSHYRNGDLIPNVVGSQEWGGQTQGAWCAYNNIEQNLCPYGKLYNWFAVNDQRNLCPLDWHVATELEWQQLEIELGLLISELNVNEQRGGSVNAGGKLKSTTINYWNGPNIGSVNEYGFSALPGGFRDPSGIFSNLNYYGFWWNATSNGSSAYVREISFNSYRIGREAYTKLCGLSVRCVKN